MMHGGFLVGFFDDILCLAPGILKLALHLLNHAFDLKFAIACPLASLALCGSSNLIQCTFHSILIHKSTSVDSILVMSIEALEYSSSASIEGEAA